MQASSETAPSATSIAAPEGAGRRALLLITVTAAALAIYEYVTLSGFVVDDAYIVLRYARNLATTGALVFNPGEHVTALTSPLHALLDSVLYALVGERTLFVYKIACCVSVALGSLLVGREFRDDPATTPVVLVMLIGAPAVTLWTFGGLETPLLFLVVAIFTATAVHALRSASLLPARTIVQLHMLAAIGFLLRHDSVCFFAPALIVVWRHRSDWGSVTKAVALAALPCLAWFAFVWTYYGDLLPTSFYVKTPQFGLHGVFSNGLYELMWLTIMGFAPLLLGAAMARGRRSDWTFELAEVPLLVGLAVTALYGLSMVQKHMMFGFRHAVPYLPALTAVLLFELRRWSLRPAILSTALLAVLVAHVAHLHRITTVSVNGFWKWSSYSEADARTLMRMVDVWKTSARDIRAHWRSLQARRPPRVFTYAGGVMPYELREAYIFEELVSARRERCASVEDIVAAADYTHVVFTPQMVGSRYYRSIAENPALRVISDQPITVEGALRHVQVYYNEKPTTLRLPGRFNDPCPGPGAAAPGSLFRLARQMRSLLPSDKMSALFEATDRPFFDRDIHAELQTAPRPFLAARPRAADPAAGAGLHRSEHRRHDLPDPRPDPGDGHVGLAVPEGPDQGRLAPAEARDLPVAPARDRQRLELISRLEQDRPPAAAGGAARGAAG